MIFGRESIDEIIAPVKKAADKLADRVVENAQVQNKNKEEIARLMNFNEELGKESERASRIIDDLDQLGRSDGMEKRIRKG